LRRLELAHVHYSRRPVVRPGPAIYTAARPAQVRECDEYIGAGGEVADLSAAQLAHYKTLQVQYWPLYVSTSVRSVLTSVQTSALQDAAGAHAAAAQTHGRTVAACVRARPG
jgi:hypothetical protein